MEILYTHACKWKNGTGETVSEMWGCWVKGDDGGNEFKWYIL
jgi:hypothetical protein